MSHTSSIRLQQCFQLYRRSNETSFCSFRLENPLSKGIVNLLEHLLTSQTQHKQILDDDPELAQTMKTIDTDSFETLAEQSQRAADALIRLARQTKPIPLEGNQFALFGSTSTGKSTMVNVFVGTDVAKTGVGETTTVITPYPGPNFVVWDIPGRNDEVSYMTMQCVALLKGLKRRVILVKNTLKENSHLMRFLDANGLHYVVVVNQMDLIDEDARPPFMEKIRAEKTKLDLKGCDDIFFVSSKKLKMFPDWSKLVEYLTTDNK